MDSGAKRRLTAVYEETVVPCVITARNAVQFAAVHLTVELTSRNCKLSAAGPATLPKFELLPPPLLLLLLLLIIVTHFAAFHLAVELIAKLQAAARPAILLNFENQKSCDHHCHCCCCRCWQL